MLTIAGGVVLGLVAFCGLAWVVTWLVAAAGTPAAEEGPGRRGLLWVYLGIVAAALVYGGLVAR